MVDFSYILTGELMTTRLSKLTDLNTKMSEFTVHKFLKQILKKKKKSPRTETRMGLVYRKGQLTRNPPAFP